MADYLAIGLFVVTFGILMAGFPVAFSLAGSALLFAGLGILTGDFDSSFLGALPERIFGIMRNETLVAVPLFVFMGVMLEKSKISEDLLETMAELLGGRRGGLGVSVCVVGGLLAASTGIVGATVVTMGLISLPSMLKKGYAPSVASGLICASGTLGQIIPPSIILVILGDVIGSAHQESQLALGVFSPTSVSVGDLFIGAIIPGALLMVFYMIYILILPLLSSDLIPPSKEDGKKFDRSFVLRLVKVLLPPIGLILAVLGSILAGVATPTEAASVGSMGALFLAAVKGQLNVQVLREVVQSTAQINSMVFIILIGASVFSLVFRGFSGDELVRHFLLNLGGGVVGSFAIVMLIMFLMGFFLDFFEITFVVVPIVGPLLLSMGLDPVWLGIMIAINLQTSFLTPPFGFALFYLRGVAPKEVSTLQIYRGVIPFIGIQLFVLLLLWFFPRLVLHG